MQLFSTITVTDPIFDMKKQNNKSRKSKDKTKPSTTQSKLNFLLIGITIILIVLGVFSYFDYFTIKDYKIFPTERQYVIDKELEKIVTTDEFSVTKKTYVLDLKGTIDLQTTSRSVQNPIKISAKLIPVPVFNGKNLTEVWDLMPTKLHYVFLEALQYPIRQDKYGIPDYAVLELTKLNSPPHYENSTEIIYQDSGTYRFFLIESLSMIHPVNGTFEFFYDSTDTNLRTRIAEVYGGDGIITIESLGQTQEAQSFRSVLMTSFFGSAIATFSIFVGLFFKREK